MERILEFDISLSDRNQTINDFLRSQGFSRQNIIALKKMKESILVNGRWKYVNYVLQENDILKIYIVESRSSKNIKPVPHLLTIVYEDEDILIINKPSGMPIHPSHNHYEDALANAVAAYYNEQGIPFIFRCINRLDKDTTGLTIIAKNMVAGSILSNMIMKREILREYLALVRNPITQNETVIPLSAFGTISAPIARTDDSVITRCVDFERGEAAVTHYQLIAQKKECTLLSLQLETGRTHQIRVHMSYLGHPLLGDTLYGSHTDSISRQALHSQRLAFSHPITKEPLLFEAPLPADMQCLI